MSTTKIVYVRARAWLVLIALLLAIAFYFIFTVVKNDTVNLINLIFMSTIGIATHFAMFPEGENYGQTTTVFVNNKLAYNSRAVAVNENRAVKELREYCEIEYTERRERYIRNQLGIIGITYEEYEEFKKQNRDPYPSCSFRLLRT